MIREVLTARKLVIVRLAPLLIVLVLTPVCLFSQTRVSSDGTDFVFGLLPIGNTTHNIYSPEAGQIEVASYDSSIVSLFSFDSLGNEILIDRITLAAGMGGFLSFYNNQILEDAAPTYRAFHLTATSPVSVQVETWDNDNGELSLILPTLGLGTKYCVESYPNAPWTANISTALWNALLGRSMALIVAAYDSTHITINASCWLASSKSLGPGGTILLHRGQAYLFEADTTSNADLSGTIISSDKPIAVFAGNNDPLLPDLRSFPLGVPGDNFRNPEVETMLPDWDWAANGYVSIPFYAKSQGTLSPNGIGELYRCFGGGGYFDGTIIDLNGASSQYSAPNVVTPVNISSPAGVPFTAIQYDYFSGSEVKGFLIAATSADASVLIPESDWKNKYAWIAGGAFTSQYINVIIRETSVSKLVLLRNQVPIAPKPIATYTIPGYPDLTGLTFLLPSGIYQATADSNFIVYSYGYDDGDSKANQGYAAPCGLMMTIPYQIAPIVSVDTFCKGWNVHVHDPRPDFMRMKKVKIFSDSLQAAVFGLDSSFNISPISLPSNFGAADFDFTIMVKDPKKPAIGHVYLLNGAGMIVPLNLSYEDSLKNMPDYTPSTASFRVLTDSDTCLVVRVWNPDTVLIPITSASVHGDGLFHLDTTGLSLPMTLTPNDTLLLDLCASTTDHDTLHHDTLTLQGYCQIQIPLSITGLLPRVNWDRDSDAETLLCGQPDTVRVWLQNNSASHSTEIIDSIVIAGLDASEFHIAANQFDYPQLVDFPMYYGEKAWIDIAFVPDMTKPLPQRWADRHASIIAYNTLHSNPVIALTAHVTYGTIGVASSEVDFGQIVINNTKSASVDLTNNGTAAVTISQITTSDTLVALSGLSPGDVLQVGETVPIQLTATALTTDSIRVLIQIWTNSICTSPDTIIVTFVGRAKGVQSVFQPAIFPPVFTCSQTSGVVTITNFGPDTMRILALRIFGTPGNSDTTGFSFTNGTRSQQFDTAIAKGSNVQITIDYRPATEGANSANLEVEWDSLGTEVFTDMTIAASSKMLHSTLSASITAVDTDYSELIANAFSVPIVLNTPPDPLAHIYQLPITISFATDLYQYNGIVPDPGLTIQDSSMSEVQGKTIISITIVSHTPIAVSEKLFTVNLLPVLAIANTDTLSLASNIAIDSGGDTLCLAAGLHDATIFVADSCGAPELRNVMQEKVPFAIEHIVPNPAGAALRVQGLGDRVQGLEVQLFDALGNCVITEHDPIPYTLSPTPYTLPLDVSRLPSGIYFLRVSNGEYAESRSVAIER